MSTNAELRKVGREALIALGVAAVAAAFMPPDRMKSIQEMLVTFLSIVAGASLPGLALTAAAPRPPVESTRAAETLGQRLEDQVRFWFGFLLFGGAAVASVLVGASLEWSLPTPRPHVVPSWVPPGGAWLVLVSVLLTTFTAIRALRIVGAVIDLVRLGTAAHAKQSEDRRRQVHDEVAEQIRRFPPASARNVVRERRDRAS